MRWRLALLPLALCLTAAARQRTVPPRFLQQVRSGRAPAAERWLGPALAAAPDDPNLRTAQAVLHTVNHEPEAALALFEALDGSRFYDRSGLRFHADALAEVGRGVEAAEMRTQRLRRTNFSHPQVQYENIRRVHDLREAGDLAAALETADDAIAFAPHQGSLYAARAEVHLERGDLDAAAFDILLAEARGTARTGTTPTAIAKARLQLAEENPEAAIRLLEPLRRRNVTSERFREVLGAAYLAADDLDNATIELRRVRFLRQDSPGIRALRARLSWQQGDPAAAREAAEALLDEVPGNADAQALFADLIAAGL